MEHQSCFVRVILRDDNDHSCSITIVEIDRNSKESLAVQLENQFKNHTILSFEELEQDSLGLMNIESNQYFYI